MFHALRSITKTIHTFFHEAAGGFYHLVVIALSAGIALLLPSGARQFLAFWSRVEQNKISLIIVEMILAVLLIGCFSYVRRSRRDRVLAKAAASAGLVSFFPRPEPRAHRHIARLKEENTTGRTIMVIGSSGYSSFVDQVGDLSSVLETCLGAQILLVNPYSPGVTARIEAIGHPKYTVSAFREEVSQSIALLKRLRAMGKTVKLKLYADPPLVKMLILGDYLWLQHYHADSDVRTMPEYVLRHNRQHHGLYSLYAHYFAQRWQSTEIPEYDLDTDDLVYRNTVGGEMRREQFGIGTAEEAEIYELPR
ncbi:MAG TPA: hypothetical protein VJL88_01930 [Nitrospira sp.]|nr:hypothetical protein [Nitrospira sp.]